MDKTYNKLIETGINLFGEYGFDAVSIRDIAGKSGVNLSAISYHFGGKNELYQAVVEDLANEVKNQLNKFNLEQFTQLELPQMEIKLSEIIIDFQKLFISSNGISRFNIFTREMTFPDKNLSHQYLIDMIITVHNFFTSVLTAYYVKRHENTNKIDFVISLIIGTLKNAVQKEKIAFFSNHDIEDSLNRLINLVLYSKI